MIHLKRNEGHSKYQIEGDPKTIQITPNVSIKKTIYNTGKGSWGVVGIEVFLNDSLVLKIDHGYGSFNYGHFIRDNKNYFVSPSESYQEAIIVCLEDEKVYKLSNDGWCPVTFHISPNNDFVAISGCFWGGPYDYRIYDISNLENILLVLTEDSKCDSENEKWVDNNTFQYDYLNFQGKDGKTQSQSPWESCEIYIENNEMKSRDLENKSFDEFGNYSKEFLDNFRDIHTICLPKGNS